MDRILMTPREALREHADRLQRAARARQAAEIYQRMRIRGRLRKAIVETIKLEGSTQELAEEFSRLARSAEQRLSKRPCC